MNPTEIKQVLSKIGGGANKRLGQHFLIDPQALEDIVQAAAISSRDIVLEIGPGLGVLTKALVEKGAEVKVIERDRRFYEYLTGVYGNKIKLVLGDATLVDWTPLTYFHSSQSDRAWKFVSNLPYSISSFALRQALWNVNPPEKIVVLIQREVAERAIAKDGKQSLLSLMVALRSRSSRIVRRVSPGAFYPPPKVESAVLEIVPMDLVEAKKRWGIDPEQVMAIAKKGFAHPRKLLASNLGIKDLTVFSSLAIPEKIRAEDMSVEQWVALAKALDLR